MVEVHSQTYPYLTFGNDGPVLSNHSYINLNAVGSRIDGTNSFKCFTDLYSCCYDNRGDDRGNWYFPNGTRLQLEINGDDIII